MPIKNIRPGQRAEFGQSSASTDKNHLLKRAVAAHPLRGLPRPGRHHRRVEGHRDVPGGAPEGDLRPGLRAIRLRGSVKNLAQTSLQTDNVFGDDGGVNQLATVTGDVAGGLSVSLAAGVDTTTAPTGAGAAPGGGPAGSPPSR